MGDLVEQVNRDLAGSPPLEIGLWLWGQTLHSAPALVALRLRRLARRGAILPGGVGQRAVEPRDGHAGLVGARRGRLSA